MVAAHEAIGVRIHAFGGADGAALDDDGDTAREPREAVAQRDGLTDQRGVDLEDDAVEADGAIVLDLALLLEEKERGQILCGERDVVGGAGPLLARRGVLQAAMRRVEILVLNPGPEALIERVEGARVGLEQGRQELEADGPKPALELPLSLRREGAGVDERHAEFGAREGEMARAIRAAVVDIEALGNAAAQDRPLEDG